MPEARWLGGEYMGAPSPLTVSRMITLLLASRRWRWEARRWSLPWSLLPVIFRCCSVHSRIFWCRSLVAASRTDAGSLSSAMEPSSRAVPSNRSTSVIWSSRPPSWFRLSAATRCSSSAFSRASPALRVWRSITTRDMPPSDPSEPPAPLRGRRPASAAARRRERSSILALRAASSASLAASRRCISTLRLWSSSALRLCCSARRSLSSLMRSSRARTFASMSLNSSSRCLRSLRMMLSSTALSAIIFCLIPSRFSTSMSRARRRSTSSAVACPPPIPIAISWSRCCRIWVSLLLRSTISTSRR
mmetsp:Transcript_54388/g.127145  ORF Transcript_54388/g.127145 Transcript_54388/m.127145 type:complete len:304 (-) Transcript_54388:3206-4117(-)